MSTNWVASPLVPQLLVPQGLSIQQILLGEYLVSE